MIVQAVRDRAEMVEYLQERLPDLEVCWDTQGDAMMTFLAALRMSGDGPTLHLEDDVLLTEGFLGKVRAGIEVARKEGERISHPHPLVQFFSMRKADMGTGSRWDRRFLANCCWYAPPGFDRELLAFFPTWAPRNATGRHSTMTYSGRCAGTDTMVQAFLRERREPYWIHCPSLVQHRIGRSAVGPRSGNRQSASFRDPCP